MPELSEQTWALVIMIAFPVLFIVLGEIGERLSLRHAPLANPVRGLRNYVLPLLAVILAGRFVAQVERHVLGLKLVETAFYIVLVMVTISFVNALLFDDVNEHSWRANVPTFVRNMSRGLLVLVGFAIVISSVWGADLKGALTALGVGSIVLGLALQGTLGGIVSGIALLIDRPFREGDVVKIGEVTGTVREMNWRSVRIESTLNDLVIMPNSQLANESIINLSRPKSWHLENFELGFSYDDSPTDVKAMLIEAASNCKSVLRDPPPRATVLSYKDSSISYQLQMAVSVGRFSDARDELLTRIWYAAQRKGLTIPFPIATTFQFDAADAETKKKESAAREAEGALLESVALEPAVVRTLIASSSRRQYGVGETIVAEGSTVHSLFFVLTGVSAIGFVDKGGRWVEVAQLSRGDVFGGGSLLRGEPSQLAFQACTDVTLLEIPAESVFGIVREHPKFASELQRLMAQRHNLVDRAREQHIDADVSAHKESERLLEMITRATTVVPSANDHEATVK